MPSSSPGIAGGSAAGSSSRIARIVLTGMGSIRVFDMVTVLKGPAFSTDMLAFHMYQSTFGLYRTSLGAAIGFLMLLLSLFLVVPYLRGTRFEEGG